MISEGSFRAGVELMEPGHWVAYVFELPGCFSRGNTEDEALAGIAASIADHINWLQDHGESVEGSQSLNFEVAERYTPSDEQLRKPSDGEIYIVNAFFEDDRRPLTGNEARIVTRLLGYSRAELIEVLRFGMSEEIERIVLHIGSAEWWYWDRLDLSFPREEVPDEPLPRLEVTRAFTIESIPSLVGRSDIKEKSGELWSGRKLVRRTLWHERDHTTQIGRIPLIGG